MRVFYIERNSSKRIEIGSYLIYFVVTIALYLFVRNPTLLMISNLGFFIALGLNYKGSFKKRILVVLLIYITLMCIETIIIFTFRYGQFPLGNDNRSIPVTITIMVASFVVVQMIESYKNPYKDETISNTYWLGIITIPIGTLYLATTIFLNTESKQGPVIVSAILVLFINFATFYMYDRIAKILSDNKEKALIEQQNKYYEKQLKLMDDSLKATKSIKHDLKNHIISLYSLAEDDKKEDVLEYLSNVTETINNKEEFANTGNRVIDSIINFKFQEAEKEKIKVTLDLNVLKEMKVPSFDMTIVLGNLLDNALNAVRKLEKNRYIYLEMKYTKGRLILKMENSFNGKIFKDKEKIDDSYNNDSGLGLVNVRTVLEKYNGTIEFEYDENKFQVALLMYVGL